MAQLPAEASYGEKQGFGKRGGGPGMKLSSMCLACMQPWVQSLAPQKQTQKQQDISKTKRSQELVQQTGMREQAHSRRQHPDAQASPSRPTPQQAT